MFNVIRIPTKFNKPISRLSDKDQLRLYKLIRDIGDGKNVIQTDDTVGDLLSLIYSEWMNMELRNGYKRESSHLSNPEGVNEPCPSDSGRRVEYSIVEDNRVDSTNEYLLSIDYLKNYSLETEIPDYAENYKEEWIKFCIYWGEKGKTGKIRAEGEKTFEIKKRFATWMSRKKEQYQQKNIKESALDITL